MITRIGQGARESFRTAGQKASQCGLGLGLIIEEGRADLEEGLGRSVHLLAIFGDDLVFGDRLLDIKLHTISLRKPTGDGPCIVHKGNIPCCFSKWSILGQGPIRMIP